EIGLEAGDRGRYSQRRMDAPLEGRLALVTGASRGIGRAIAHRLAAEGARVIAAARSVAAIEALAGELPGEGQRAVETDVSDPDSLAGALDRVREIGTVELLINNAGVAESAPFERTGDDLWDLMMEVNATSVFRLCRSLIPPMVEAGRGRVVIVASNAGL